MSLQTNHLTVYVLIRDIVVLSTEIMQGAISPSEYNPSERMYIFS
jgi:hypothetical protein